MVTGRWRLEHWREIKSFFISTQERKSFCVSLCLGILQSSESKTGRAHPEEGSLGV